MGTKWSPHEAEVYIKETIEFWLKQTNIDKLRKIADFCERGRKAGESTKKKEDIKKLNRDINRTEELIKSFKERGANTEDLQNKLITLVAERTKLLEGYTPPVKRTNKK